MSFCLVLDRRFMLFPLWKFFLWESFFIVLDLRTWIACPLQLFMNIESLFLLYSYSLVESYILLTPWVICRMWVISFCDSNTNQFDLIIRGTYQYLLVLSVYFILENPKKSKSSNLWSEEFLTPLDLTSEGECHGI